MEVRAFLSRFTEDQIAENGYWSCAYAEIVLRNHPFPKGEKAIALAGTEEYGAYDTPLDQWYALYILKDLEPDWWFIAYLGKHKLVSQRYVRSFFGWGDDKVKEWCRGRGFEFEFDSLPITLGGD